MRILGVIAAIAALSCGSFAAHNDTLLNVSYDVARDFYEKYNALFIEDYKKKTGRTIKVNQSHAGSTKQARAVVDGLEADVVTMNQTTDVDFIAERGRNLVAKDWRKKFSNNASPYTSTMAIMVRKGNPKGIKDWDDLAKLGISVVIPNPKTAGNGRYSYLAMWAFAKEKFGGDEEFVRSLLGVTLRSSDSVPAELRSACAAADFATLASLAHKVKGTAGDIVATALQSRAREAELAARASDPGAIALNLELADTVDEFLGEVRSAVARSSGRPREAT